MKINRILSLSAMVLIGIAYSQAAPVSIEEAKTEAATIMEEGSGLRQLRARKSASASASLSLAYTAVKDNTGCFYVFNVAGGGSIYITADDRLPALLGYTTEGEFDASRIPENLKWWLSEYEKQIVDYLATDPKVHKSVRKASSSDYATIAPMVKTKWNQTAPYNNMCPVDNRTGQLSVTGCVATAMAQIMKYHEWPIHPQGTANGYIFTNTTLDWANMLDEYTDYRWTTKQADAVALLMRQCGAGVDMMYSSWASGAYSFDVPDALVKYFDYNPSMELHYRQYYNQRQWNKLVYDELAAGRPVYYSGNSNEGGHAFVCDGYDSADFFHFNWGWGGYEDGYFRLYALNPGTGGTGSSSGGYNADQCIITGLKKADGNTRRQQLLVATGNFVYDGSSYVIEGGGTYNFIYNPLAYAQTFNPGLKITPFDGGEPTYVKSSSKTSLRSMYGFSEINIKVPMLADGKYKVAPAMYNCYSEWQDIQVPYGMQNYVTLTVSAGKQTFSNNGAPEETISHIIPSMPQYVGPIYADDNVAFNMTVSNVGKGDYYSTLVLGIYGVDASGSVIEMDAMTSVPGKASTDLEFYSYTPIKEGDYELYFFDSEYNELLDPVKFTVLPARNTKTPKGNLTVTNIGPAFPYSQEKVGISLTAQNSSSKNVEKTIKIELKRASDLEVVKTLTASASYIFPAEETVILNFNPSLLDVAPGDYYWLCSDTDGNPLSTLQPVKVYGQTFNADGLNFLVTDEAAKTAMLISADTPTLIVNVPEEVNGYKITEMRPDVFTFDTKLKRLTLPGSITTIPSGEFYCSSALRFLTMDSRIPLALHQSAFAPGAEDAVVISGADGGYTNIFHSDPAWASFKMSQWIIEWPENFTPDSGMLKDADGNIYNPYYIGAFEPLNFFYTLPDEHRLETFYTIGDSQEYMASFAGEVWIRDLEGKIGRVRFQPKDCTTVDELGPDEMLYDIYTIDGILVMSKATKEDLKKLPKGIYISGGKKIRI